jgi:hypothetical protein
MMSDGSPMEPARPRVVYVSYDGMAEPLGRSQVLAYLLRLAETADIWPPGSAGPRCRTTASRRF